MKKNKNDNGYLLVVLACCLVAVILVYLINYLAKGKALKADDSLVQELYSYLGENDLQYCGGLTNYATEEVASKDLANDVKLCHAVAKVYLQDSEEVSLERYKKKDYCQIDENTIFALDEDKETCSINKISKDIIKDEYHKIYGEDLKEEESVNINNQIICYPSDDSYMCGRSVTFTVTIGSEPQTYRTINKVYKKKDEIIIYDYFLKIIKDECYLSYTSNSKDDNCTSEYQNNKNIDYKFLKKYGSLYQHIYKMDDTGNYYWVSSKQAK